MYPFIRLAKEIVRARRLPRLPLTGTHVSHHICWPWDLDMFIELNNGRSLSLYDLGRIPLATRIGLDRVLARRRWGLSILGTSVRWRYRVRPFVRIKMRSRAIGWDARFVYIEQGMWFRDGRCAGHALFRTAVTDAHGIVPIDDVIAAMGRDDVSPTLPSWAQAWVTAEAERPWPPRFDER